MSYKTALKECLRDCERNRNRALTHIEELKTKLYNEIPRVREIDETLAQTGIHITKSILLNKKDAGNYIEDLAKVNLELNSEKAKLLAEHGIPEDYFDRAYSCKHCKDTGYVENKLCICLKQMLINKHYGLSSLRDIVKQENFEYFDIRYYSAEVDPSAGISPRANIERIYQICLDFVINFDSSNTNLLFYGNTGLGKTFLCNCISKDLLDSGKTVLYCTAPKLFKMFESLRFGQNDDNELEDYIDMTTTADLLIIDDLGTEFPTVVTSSELFNIVNTRILDNKHTIISTNLFPNEFEALYSQRIISRFVGSYYMLKFFGKDIRVSKKYS